MEQDQEEKKTEQDKETNKDKETVPTKEELEQKQQELQALETQLAKREEKINNQESANKKNRITQLVDQLIKEGRILPRDREGIMALMDRLQESGVIEFSEGGTEQKNSEAASYFESFIKRLPVQVEFAETTPDNKNDLSYNTLHYPTPRGYQVDQDGLAAHNKILSYAKSHDIDYLTAALSIDK
ncbi:MAG: hypothetical protein HQL69_06725 [Magnetococcales bacterium]|nr:hypothetical protein [Magnetococcales bacterium]